ncbi:hypothetical protein RhiirA4_509632 [Rhizophagus irregularis]|uniref:Uncharacterized protein n=1 Tax=Rhizophagus irregularis TaxID=588596 RepID=A0A2I1HEI7_9GLOM|nr:hypothetical protein RhiirA4_509632 [Rhizophagus irregularis]
MEAETQSNTSASETKIDISDIKEHREEIEKTPSETKDDIFAKTEMHRKSIHQILVSQYMDDTEYGSDDYVVTYSDEDRSVLGWSVNVENNGPQQPDVYFKVDQINEIYRYPLSTLSKKILLLSTDWLIDLNSDRTSSDRFLKLKEYQVLFGAFGFLPNGDLIYASAIDCKIYKYRFTDKPKNTVSWEYSQIIDIKIPESLNGQVKLAIYQTKLFLNIDNNSKMFQFDLLTMNLERKYHEFTLCSQDQIAVNKNQTLLAIRSREGTINIYSMENGMLIYSNYNLFAGGKKTKTKSETICASDSTFSIKLLNNQDLVVINMHGIGIYTLNENMIERYFWHNNEWKNFSEKFDPGNVYDIIPHFKPLIGKILQNEFDDSKHSIPFPTFIIDYEKCLKDIFPSIRMDKYYRRNRRNIFEDVYRRDIVEDVINDNLVSSKFGIKMLKIAIKEKQKYAIQQIIESTQDYSENYMTIISLNLVELCDYYPDFIIKYISSTSIILSPYCIRIGNSKNPSLHSYANIIYIKESNMDNNVFKPISANYEVVNFIVPFPQICVYQDSKNNDYENNMAKINHNIKSKIIIILKKIITGLKIIIMIPKSNSIWNEFLYKPKYILFCNIDSNHFYNWWNFAAIINFKWKTFGKVYYYLIWLFYTIFYGCYSIASTLDQKFISNFYFKLLFIISIIFGSTFLIFEIRQCLWNYKYYFKDIWNLFAIDDYNKKEEFLLQKAQIIMEIELFYMLPWQRNNKKWFPDWIYYDIPITKIRKLINAIDNEQTVFNYPPIISKKLRELVVLSDDDNNKLEKKIDQLTKQNVELKEELIKQNVEFKEELIKQNVKLKEDLIKQNVELKEELIKQNVEFKQQMEHIMNYIGV